MWDIFYTSLNFISVFRIACAAAVNDSYLSTIVGDQVVTMSFARTCSPDARTAGMLAPTRQPEFIDRSLSDAIRTGDVDTVRARLTAGEKPTEDDIDEAESGEFPEVCKLLIGAGFMDSNRDFGSGGDLLINAVWELKVNLHPIHQPLRQCANTRAAQLRLTSCAGSSQTERIPTPVT